MSGTFCLCGPSSLLSGEAWCWAQGLTPLASKGLFSSLSGSNKACTVPWADGQGGVGYPPEAGDFDLPLADSTGRGGGLRGGGGLAREGAGPMEGWGPRVTVRTHPPPWRPLPRRQMIRMGGRHLPAGGWIGGGQIWVQMQGNAKLCKQRRDIQLQCKCKSHKKNQKNGGKWEMGKWEKREM